MMRRIATALLGAGIGALGLTMVACVEASSSGVQTPKGAPAPCNADELSSSSPSPQPSNQPAATPVEPGTYQIGRADELTIQIDPELGTQCSKLYVVGNDGKINFCALGAISLEGKTSREVEAMIRQQFVDKKIYAGSGPNVTVTMQKYRSQTVYVSGEVKTPGEQALDGRDMTLMHAINAAGGWTPNSGPDVFVLRRRPTGASGPAQAGAVTLDDPNVQRFQYSRKVLISTFEDPPVQAGDTILVSQAEMFFINGEIKSPGQKVFEPCMTVGDAISMSGGLTEKASLGRSYIQRRNARGSYDKIDVKMETQIQPRDTIVIRPKLF